LQSNFSFMDGADPTLRTELVSLASLPVGGQGLVVEVRADDAVGERLLDLGLVPGTSIAVLRRAPLGDPSVYEFRGYQLCLRRSEAQRVSVRRLPDAERVGLRRVS
jgi:ferrous iron transport protein A